MTEVVRYLTAENMTKDDFGHGFTNQKGEVIYDARTKYRGQWATMTEDSFKIHGHGLLGQGFGQKYVRQENGELHKVEG
jgi:hypothetical protein